MKKGIWFLLIVILLTGLVSSYNYQTRMNPWTGKPDFHITSNFSSENISVDNLDVGGYINAVGNITTDESFVGYQVGNTSLWSGDSGNVWPTNWDRPGFNTFQLGLGTNDPEYVLDVWDWQPTVAIRGTDGTQTSMLFMGNDLIENSFMIVSYPYNWYQANYQNDVHIFSLGDMWIDSGMGIINITDDTYIDGDLEVTNNVTAENFVGTHVGNTSLWSGDGTGDVYPTEWDRGGFQTARLGLGTNDPEYVLDVRDWSPMFALRSQTNNRGIQFEMGNTVAESLFQIFQYPTTAIVVGGPTFDTHFSGWGDYVWEQTFAGKKFISERDSIFKRSVLINDSLNVTNGNLNVVNNISSNYLFGNLPWNNITDYPVACPAYSAITQLDDSVTCTDYKTGFFGIYSSGNFKGSLYTDPQWINSSASDSNALFQVISDTRGTPQFQVQNGGVEQASFIARSFMIVNQNNTLLNSSQNNLCSSWGFDQLDCNTATTGADFGVTDDAQILGLLYSSGLRAYSKDGNQKALLVATENASEIYSGLNGSYNSVTNIFCDYVSDNFVSPADGWININDIDSSFEGSWANYGVYINSSCVRLYNNPNWKTSFSNTGWRLVNNPELIITKDGLMQYYVGDDEASIFEVDISNGTGPEGFYIDDVVGASNHKAFSIEQDMNGRSSIAQNILMYSNIPIVDKVLTALNLEGDATNMNSSDGIFIDMRIIGEPLEVGDGGIDGIRVDPGVDHIIKMGSKDVVDVVYYNGINITSNVTNGGTDPIVFSADNDYLYIGNSLNFTNIGISLSRVSSASITPKYYYCNSTGNWKTLTGVSSTLNRFIVSGSISFPNPTDRGVCNKQFDGTPFSNTNNYTYIAIKRTKNNIVTPPIINTISIGGGSTYFILQKDMMRLVPSAGDPEPCDASLLGAMYFDSDWDDLCVCKSTGSWTLVGSDNLC